MKRNMRNIILSAPPPIIPAHLRPFCPLWLEGSQLAPVYYPLTQSCVNGSFDTDLTGWTENAGGGTLEASATQKKFGAKSLHIVASAQTVNAYQDLTFTNGHKIYIRSWIWLVSGSLSSSIFTSAYDKGGTSNAVSLINTSMDASWRYASNEKVAANGGIRLYSGRISNQTAEYYVDGDLVIDKTAAFGSGLEPSTAEMDDIIDKDLALYWESTRNVLCNPGSRYFWYDYSGNGHTAKLSNMAYAPGSGWTYNPARLQIDVTDDDVVIPKSAVINNITNLTVVTGVYFAGAGGGTAGRIFDKTAGTGSGRYLFFDTTADLFYIAFRQYFTGGATLEYKWTTPALSIAYGQWYYIAITYNNAITSDPIIYINNVPQTLTKSGTASGTAFSDAANDLHIGNRSALNRALNGDMAFQGWFTKILTAGEIQQLLNNNHRRLGM